MLIERPPMLYRLLFPGAIFRMKPSGKSPGTLYLTFDDGPIPEATPWVLDILDDFGIKATFFLVGQNVERYPSLKEEILKRGHAIGNHTLHHIKGPGISKREYADDTHKAAQLIDSKLFRPPHGFLTLWQLREIKKNFKVVMFDLVTRDYSRWVKADQIVKNIKRYSRDGSVIVFHDSLKSIDKLKTALPASLEWLKNKGFEFKTLE